ncbi:ribosomal protein S5 domain 2-like protein [Cylindrobasidium torrendii FP15055 ss-10]|uniref:Ribosomal protein S5 domain 2-like protein n=1 Tax=Cylindrobasidium torrendii FP15055 ss-10 TaxID=1314674 RepID=A0A0D7BNT2_9AGAR|nr:ribosomal protein S5 domain 2-like protein [Cylindrobasidium torrendii FP15055 ss-10]
MAAPAFDRRRVNGPEESFPPVFEEDREVKKISKRTDRENGDFRPVFLQPGLITQANGSAYIETSKTKISCAIYGPHQSKNAAYSENGRLNVEVKYAPYSCHRRKAPIRDAEDRTIGVAIHQALLSSVRLELLPKSTIDIFIIIIESDGLEASIAAGSIAASTALADAGIELFGLVTSCSAFNEAQALMDDNDLWIDPTLEEAQAAKGTLILSTMPALETVTSVWQNGRMQPADVLKCMELCQQRCVQMHAIVARSLVDNNQVEPSE